MMTFSDFMDKRIGDDVELKRMVAEETVNVQVVQEIYDLRTKAGLTQSMAMGVNFVREPFIYLDGNSLV